GEHVSYLYMISNPFGWAMGLLGLFLTISFFSLKGIFKNLQFKAEDERKLFVLSILYIGYMLSMSRIIRGMYIYNYFIPLIFTFGMASHWIPYIMEGLKFKTKNKIFISQLIFASLIVGSWYFYSPLTYFSPLSCSEFKNRALFDGWDMRGVSCKFGQSLYRLDEALKEKK
ncbi:MAG: hypothetical protein WCK43_09690, partial [bacterium]